MKITKITQEQVARVLWLVDQGLSEGVGKPIPGHMGLEAAVCYAFDEPLGGPPTVVAETLYRFKFAFNNARWGGNEARAKGLRRLAVAQLGTAGTLDELLFVEELSTAIIAKLLPRALRSAASVQEEPLTSKLLRAANRCERERSFEAALWAREVAFEAERLDNDTGPDFKILGPGRPAVRWDTASAAREAAEAAADGRRLIADGVALDSIDDFVHFSADAAGVAVAAAAIAVAAAVAFAANDVVGVICWTPADQVLSWFAEEVVQILVSMKTPGSEFLFLTEQQFVS